MTALTMITLRLACATFWVDVRLREIHGRWIASADTPDGPSLGLGLRAIEAVESALEPFEGLVAQLLATAPPELWQLGPPSQPVVGPRRSRSRSLNRRTA
jgi:hypothetical protein